MTAPMVYVISGWDELYETSELRRGRVKRMSWVKMRVRLDGDGYACLVGHHEHGAAHFGVWCALLQVGARCKPRGVLVTDTGLPHDSYTLATKTRLPQPIVEEALHRLCDRSLRWVTRVPFEPIRTLISGSTSDLWRAIRTASGVPPERLRSDSGVDKRRGEEKREEPPLPPHGGAARDSSISEPLADDRFRDLWNLCVNGSAVPGLDPDRRLNRSRRRSVRAWLRHCGHDWTAVEHSVRWFVETSARWSAGCGRGVDTFLRRSKQDEYLEQGRAWAARKRQGPAASVPDYIPPPCEIASDLRSVKGLEHEERVTIEAWLVGDGSGDPRRKAVADAVRCARRDDREALAFLRDAARKLGVEP